jgi:hypothetical protein
VAPAGVGRAARLLNHSMTSANDILFTKAQQMDMSVMSILSYRRCFLRSCWEEGI